MSALASTVWVDMRWDGAHGIGRYARETISRMSMTSSPLPAKGSPSSPREAIRADDGVGTSDIVYSPGYNASRRSAARQLLTVHDLIHLEVGGARGALYRAYYDGIVRPVIIRAGRVITVSETSASAIRGWLRDDRVEVVNAGIGLSEAFAGDGPALAAPRPYVMYVGNLRRHKNVGMAFESIRGRDVDLIMVIPEAEADAAREQAHQRGVAAQLILHHGVDDPELATMYRGAAATLMPSLLEGFGLPALESVAVGTPVVYWTGCHSVAEIVGTNGVAVKDAHSASAWRDALRVTLDGYPVSSDVATRYSWDRTASAVESTILRMRAEVTG